MFMLGLLNLLPCTAYSHVPGKPESCVRNDYDLGLNQCADLRNCDPVTTPLSLILGKVLAKLEVPTEINNFLQKLSKQFCAV